MSALSRGNPQLGQIGLETDDPNERIFFGKFLWTVGFVCQGPVRHGNSEIVMADLSTNSVAATPPIDWEAAFAEHFGWLRSVVAARLGEAQAVDDVMQEVAAAAVASSMKAPLSDPTKVAPWLYRIAVRQTLLYRRSCGRRRKLVKNFAERKAPRETDNRIPNPLAWMLSHERAARFQEVMDQLPDRDREVLMLKYEHGWSYQRISEQLGISMSAVETRLHRARRRLREKLARQEIAYPGE